MAEDTRQKASPPPSAPREVSHALSRETQPSASRWHGYFYPPTKPPDSGSITAQAQGDTPPPINVMPGGTANTAGGEKIEDYSFWDVFKSVRPQEFQYLHTLPCVRDSFLIGIPSGIVALGVGIVLRSKLPLGESGMCHLQY